MKTFACAFPSATAHKDLFPVDFVVIKPLSENLLEYDIRGPDHKQPIYAKQGQTKSALRETFFSHRLQNMKFKSELEYFIQFKRLSFESTIKMATQGSKSCSNTCWNGRIYAADHSGYLSSQILKDLNKEQIWKLTEMLVTSWCWRHLLNVGARL